MIELLLTLVSGVAWLAVYAGIIVLGFRQKSAAMPLFALGLNFAWEVLCTFTDIVFLAHGPLVGLNLAQVIVNVLWACFDLLIVVIYFKYGRERWPKSTRSWFIPGSLLVFACCFALQGGFFVQFGAVDGALYAAFLQNLLMSVLFMTMLFNRADTRGQSLVVGIAKWLGTLAPALLFGLITQINPLIIVCGIFCCIFDIAYVILLSQKKKGRGTLSEAPGNTPFSA